MAFEVLAQKTWRIGVLKLVRDDSGRYFVSLDNRTYHNRIEIPASKVERWVRCIETGR